jgi:hypothetical protein
MMVDYLIVLWKRNVVVLIGIYAFDVPEKHLPRTDVPIQQHLQHGTNFSRLVFLSYLSEDYSKKGGNNLFLIVSIRNGAYSVSSFSEKHYYDL